ncbi:MAG: hypothetical protein JEZ04_06160 [Spirochaetales bacterium]|nr:hypothetical protein [Spirochaetales bacterium]
MDNKARKYLEILMIELEDLIIDLEFGEEVLLKRLEKQEITEYVFKENIGLLKKEVLGIEKLRKVVAAAGTEKRTIEELKTLLAVYFAKEIKAAGLPNIVFLLVNRKLEKITRYMSLDD